ncbi:GUN4 domain-containing protein [Leptothoe kymatousa]|uniref:GUN4 domain-containing protein n=1 Tax=Leptothoe kymatousa TAU-MAC 1615 TaxID=2364775 RepID=A0ABS5Y1Q0_9CYAN|nr:GUN4 domain-containing protein [Leptothoe kymatousa]MBT9311747.1 GUN4 domain-containing protein [Leptothoe kymatousa TAU-MAC 1615]
MSSGNEPPDKSLEEKLADAATKFLVLGGGGYGLYNLYLEDIPKAAISFGISLTTSLITSFGQGLMVPIKEWVHKLGKKTGTAVTIGASSTIENWSGIDAKYLKALQAYCYALEVEGFKADLPPLELKEIFVPIRLDSAPNNSADSDSIKRIWELLPKHKELVNERYRRLAIIADPGYGKTTLTRYLTLNYADQSHRGFGAADRLPILLLFRAMHGQIQDAQTPSLPELILDQVGRLPRCQDLEVSVQWFKQRLDQGKCLVMLDGLDEVPNARRELVSRWVNWQMQAYPSQFILTSRPHGYDSSLFQGIARVGILDFTVKDKEVFINKWYRTVLWHKKWETLWERSKKRSAEQQLSETQAREQCEAEAIHAARELMGHIVRTPALNDLAKNPLLVTIIAATYEAFEYLPDKRVKLYKKMFDLLLENRPYRRETQLTVTSVEESQPVLQQLAFSLTKAGQEKFTPKQGSEWIYYRLAKVQLPKPIKPQNFLKEIQTIAGLLTGEEGGLYEFTHKTFQEYLTALEIFEQYSKDYLLRRLDNSDWREVISFYTAITEATPFILAILDNPTPEKLKFARRVVIEERSKTQAAVKEMLVSQLAKADLGAQANARVKLEQRFSKLTLQDGKLVTSEPITLAEYGLFLEDQRSKQFHSYATEQTIDYLKQGDQPVQNISDVDAQWFCGWLSTQTELAADARIYHYRPFFDDPDDKLCVVREQVNSRYANLINYLANARWQEADRETENIMLGVANCKSRGYLDVNDIKAFSCEDLQLIDQLWLKFSGGRYGFSVQQEIYLNCSGKTNYKYSEKVEKFFLKKVGWEKNDHRKSKMKYAMSAPRGHLPRINVYTSQVEFQRIKRSGFHSRFKPRNIIKQTKILHLSFIVVRIISCVVPPQNRTGLKERNLESNRGKEYGE